MDSGGKLLQIDQAQHLLELPRTFSFAVQFAQSHGNVLRRCLPGKEAVVLVNRSHSTGADHAARRWLQKPREQIEQGRLATAGWTNHRHEFATSDLQREITENFDCAEAH